MEIPIMTLVRILLNNGNTHNDPCEDFTEQWKYPNEPCEDFAGQ